MAVPCICSVAACNKPATHRGWCGVHYGRWRRHGDPLGGGTANGEPRRFLETVVMPFEGDECLPWPYATNSAGYGKLSVDGKLVHVHRLACEARWGPPPSPKHEAAHSCGKGHLGCCNPKHVSWKTPAENQRDKLAHGTAARGAKNALAKLSEEDVREIRRLRGLVSEKEIAKMFGVSRGCISGIFTGKNWSWLNDEGTRK